MPQFEFHGRCWAAEVGGMLLYSSSIFLSFSIACTLIYVLVMNFIRNGMFKTFAHCMRSTHTYTADATKIFLFDFVIVLLLLFFAACAHYFSSTFIISLLPFKFHLIEYYMVNIASSADLSCIWTWDDVLVCVFSTAHSRAPISICFPRLQCIAVEMRRS